jgi:hypothetical protein
MSTVRQRVVAALVPGPGPGSNDPTGPHPEWLGAVATDGSKVVVTYPDTLDARRRSDNDKFVQGTFTGMKNAGISYEDDPERYMREMTRHPLGGSSDTVEYPSFEDAAQAALQTFQTPVSGA